MKQEGYVTITITITQDFALFQFDSTWEVEHLSDLVFEDSKHKWRYNRPLGYTSICIAKINKIPIICPSGQ